jgi:putative DNA primase/helicase
MTAEAIAKALGGRKMGGSWMARCPAHDDRTPSLSIRDADDGRVLIRCHAGCEQKQVIAILRSRGLWTENGGRVFKRFVSRSVTKRTEPDSDDVRRTEAALAIWQVASPAGGSLVETYLASRGLQLPPTPTLRFHGSLKHPSGDVWPAMIALVTHGSNHMRLAIHRTFLARDGAGKAPVEPQKMMLGPCGGGAVRLGESSDVLMIAEGIETALSAMQATGQPAWAALSTSGLRSLKLPWGTRDLIILADGDDAGETAARECGRRWQKEGRRVRVARPPQGLDFNDLLVSTQPDGGHHE